MKKMTAVMLALATSFAASSSHAESQTLQTRTGNEIGLSLGSYRYQEPGIMSLKGAKIGLDMRVTRELAGGPFLRGDFRYAFGAVDYASNGTGSASGNQDWYIEGRVLIGKDLLFNRSVYALYTGLGYRYLFNDARGITSTGAAGYRRESNYLWFI